jgi:hypothetical protein
MKRTWCVVALGLLASAGCSKVSGLFGAKPEGAETSKAHAPSAPTPAPTKARIDGAATTRPTIADHGTAAQKPVRGDTAATATFTPPPAHARGSIFGRLPKGTLFALRLPDVTRLGEAFRRSSLTSLFDNPLVAPQRASLEQGMKQLKADLFPDAADYEALVAEVGKLTGELVVAMPSVDLLAAVSGANLANGPTFTVAFIYDAGASADSFQHLLDRGIELSKKNGAHGSLDTQLPIVAAGTTTWMRRHRDDRSCMTLARDGQRFTLTVTNAPSVLAASDSLTELPLEESFNAADLVRATPDLAADGGKPVTEVFLNLAPIWTAVTLALPPEAREPLANSGLASIGGLSLTSALGANGIDESLLLFSPGGRDLISRFCTGKPLGTALASWLPGDATDASLLSLDFGGLFDSLRGVIPAAARRSFDDGMAQMHQQTGVDLRSDVFGNLGPNFAFSSRGGYAELTSGGDFEWICAVELQDATRARHLLDKFLKQSGLAATIKTEKVDSYSVSSTDLPPLSTPFGQQIRLTPAWLIDDHALVFAAGVPALRKAVAAAKEHGSPPALRDALASAGVDAFSVSVKGNGKDAVTTVGRRSPAGLVVESIDGRGAMATGALAGGAAIAASVALPRLLQNRVAGNEAEAIETLKAIWSAETTLRNSQVIDVDHDAHGEFGTLAELAGSVPPRGRTTPAPVLDAAFAPDAKGILVRGGYMFRVDLPTKTGGGVATLDPAAPSPVATDLAEQQFIAYAWPVDPPTTGVRVFVVDASGALFFTKNDGDQQHYCATRAPAFEAAQLRDPSDRIKGVTMVRRGRDNGIWLEQR